VIAAVDASRSLIDCCALLMLLLLLTPLLGCADGAHSLDNGPLSRAVSG
jgi:hypothetical protein